jgi:hypothetical protein
MLYLTIARGPHVAEATTILAVSDQGFVKGVLACMGALAIDEYDCDSDDEEAATEARKEPENAAGSQSGQNERGPPKKPTQ